MKITKTDLLFLYTIYLRDPIDVCQESSKSVTRIRGKPGKETEYNQGQ